MTKREIIGTFYKFLKDRNALQEFIENFRIQKTKYPEKTSPKKIFLICMKEHFSIKMGGPAMIMIRGAGREIINYAIEWSATPQGHTYWERLNSSWNTSILRKTT